METRFTQFFISFSKATLVAIFLIVVAGGVVRMTGSGMGCPDWPKCFERYIPPSSVDELPENYKEIYAEKRAGKIEKFATYLIALGLNEKAEQLVADESLLIEQDFNPIHTWTEYINRLTGAISGVFIFGCFILSLFSRHNKRALISLGLLQIIITFFQAWMGSIVVATNLVPWVLTVHMLLAAAIIFIQLAFIRKIYSNPKTFAPSKKYILLIVFGSILALTQVLLGTQVRQGIDEAMTLFIRSEWIENVGDVFKFHRSFAILILLSGGLLYYINLKKDYAQNLTLYILFIIFLEAVSGVILYYADMMAAMQPIHLTLSFILLAAYFSLILRIKAKH